MLPDRPGDAGEFFLGLGLSAVGCLDALGQILRCCDERRLLFFRSLGDELAVSVLLGAKGLERCDRVAPGLVGSQSAVDEVNIVTASREGRTNDVGVRTQKCGVNHG